MVILRILIVWPILGEHPVIFEKDGERLLNGLLTVSCKTSHFVFSFNVLKWHILFCWI